MTRRLMYVARDGSYGIAEGLWLFDVTQWSDDDWQALEMATDTDRWSQALDLASGKGSGALEVFADEYWDRAEMDGENYDSDGDWED